MKISKERFVLIVLISVLFSLTNIVSNLNAQEIQEIQEIQGIIDLHHAYESVFYSYNFRLHNPEGYIETEWRIKGDYPGGMKLHSGGLFSGTPTLLTKDEQRLLENTEEELNELKKSGDLKAKKLKELEKKLKELEQKSAGEREFLFRVKACGKVKASESITNETVKLETASRIYQVRLIVKKIPRWCATDDMFMVGLEQSGASSAQAQQKVFLRIYMSSPFPFNIRSKSSLQLGKRIQMWGNINLTSLPQQINDPLVKVPEVFTNKIKNLNINEIARALEFLIGLDIRILNLKSKYGRKWYTFNIIGAYGATTPTAPRDSLQYFKLPDPLNQNVIDKLKGKYGEGLDLTGKKYISFLKPDRSKFYRQWFFGFRLKSYKKPEPIIKQKDGALFVNEIKTQFPAFFEVSLGRNDFIVDKELILEEYQRAKALQVPFEKEKRWLVLRIGGILPIEIKSINIYFFGTAILNFKRDKTPLLNDPIILEPALETTFPDNEVEKITLKTEYRDYYRIGVGIDLKSIIEKIF